MKPAPFDYHAPATLAEAVGLLASLDNVKILAGGQSLVPMMNFRYVIIDHLVDLNAVPELAGISLDGDVVRIGGVTRQRDLEFSDVIAERLPLLREALGHVGHRQTRNRGTIGGSLSHADPSAEQPCVCAAYDATIELHSARGTRRLPFADFGAGFMATTLEADEILSSIEIPLWSQGHGYGFHEFARRRGDFAIVGCAALLELSKERVITRASLTLAGVATKPLRVAAAEELLVGQLAEAATLRAAAKLAAEIEPITDIHASGDYRRHLARVLAERALTDAAHRAR
ncbi:MAG TPA: xanthine dehydrogenase family protein subunit M [Beijerinckiaceae bacterium]|jgi:carbon-monoxide dehydrogenase medium subunit|nr:xanthine dehydrogenase family protein subunit M [Beijerinckiaceae bacterium]